ncbi:carboxymuconolactone decarboxylase, partial [marine sediment metagenome]
GKEGLIELTSIILQINSWNRISVSLQFQPSI